MDWQERKDLATIIVGVGSFVLVSMQTIIMVNQAQIARDQANISSRQTAISEQQLEIELSSKDHVPFRAERTNDLIMISPTAKTVELSIEDNHIAYLTYSQNKCDNILSKVPNSKEAVSALVVETREVIESAAVQKNGAIEIRTDDLEKWFGNFRSNLSQFGEKDGTCYDVQPQFIWTVSYIVSGRTTDTEEKWAVVTLSPSLRPRIYSSKSDEAKKLRTQIDTAKSHPSCYFLASPSQATHNTFQISRAVDKNECGNISIRKD